MPGLGQPTLPDVPHLQNQTFCLQCGYSLRGLTTYRCPECGRAFDPDDPDTVYQGHAPGPLGRFFLKPLGWPMHAMATLAGILTLLSCSVPGGYFLLIFLGFGLWAGIGALWCCRAGLAVAATGYYRRPWRGLLHPSWLVAPCVFALIILALSFEAPERITFALSRPALDRFVRQTLASPTTPASRQWVGLYPIGKVERRSGSLRITIRGTGRFFVQYSFEYCPTRPGSTQPYAERYTHFADNWYTVKSEFN